jgi:hypothetical protein
MKIKINNMQMEGDNMTTLSLNKKRELCLSKQYKFSIKQKIRQYHTTCEQRQQHWIDTRFDGDECAYYEYYGTKFNEHGYYDRLDAEEERLENLRQMEEIANKQNKEKENDESDNLSNERVYSDDEIGY